MSEPIIQFQSVTKRFGPLTILDEISFTIHKGEITTVVGKSGVGKSVILKHIIGLMQADSGQVLFDGTDMAHLSRHDRHRLKSRMGYMFQNIALFDSMTVYDNIALPLREKSHMTEKAIHTKIYENLEKLEIVTTADKYPSEISGGMQKRVGLARALIRDPEIVLFDEPTTGLDPIRKNAVHSMISHMQRKFNFTGIVVSHEIPDVFYISQKILMLEEGKIIVDAPPAEVETIDNITVQDFIRGSESLRDDLTGLATKTVIVTKLEETTASSADAQWNYSVIAFRVNDLDGINENMGFVVGQMVLQHLAKFIENYLLISDDNFRYSDDIVVTILPNTRIGMARALVKKMSGAMAGYSSAPPEDCGPVKYSVSVGVSESADGKNIEDVVGTAAGDMSIVGEFDLK